MIQYYSVTRKHTQYNSGQNHRKATATVETISKQLEHVTTGLSRCSWSPTTTGPPRPSAANYVAIDGPLDQVWLPWMVRFAATGPP